MEYLITDHEKAEEKKKPNAIFRTDSEVLVLGFEYDARRLKVKTTANHTLLPINALFIKDKYWFAVYCKS